MAKAKSKNKREKNPKSASDSQSNGATQRFTIKLPITAKSTLEGANVPNAVLIGRLTIAVVW